MAAMELDPLFVKALGFLRSKTKESADQLRELLDDVIAGSGKPGGKSKMDKPQSSFGGALKSADERGLAKSKRGQSSPLSKGDKARRDSEKRSAERAKLDPSDSDSAPIKKSKIERPQRQATKPAVVEDSNDSDDDTDDSNNDSRKEDAPETTTGGSTDADDFALELGLACVMCKKMDVSAGNNLIECQECHNLYHQQCHKPAATDADPNDPRLVWYCARCARNMKRQASKKPKSLPSSGRGDLKGYDKSDETSMNLFKRSEQPKTVSPSGTSKQPFTGLASMAANLSGRPASSSSSSSSKPSKAQVPAGISSRSSSRSSTSSPVSKSAPSKQYSSSSGSSKSSSSKGGNSGKAMSQTQTASAMKRLHMMKKKASKR